MILQDMTCVSLVSRLIREHLIGLVLDLDQDKCAKNRILFVLLIKKLVSTWAVHQVFHDIVKMATLTLNVLHVTVCLQI